MDKKKTLMTTMILALFLLSGCDLSDTVCVVGENLTYDGKTANGKVKISLCDGTEGKDVTVIHLNQTNFTEQNLTELPIFEE